MIYNLLISKWDTKYNVFGLDSQDLQIAVTAFLQGSNSFTIAGEKYYINRINSFKIFTYEEEDIYNSKNYYLNNIHYHKRTMHNKYLPIETLQIMGKDVTSDFIGNKEYGADSIIESNPNFASNNEEKNDLSEINRRLDEVIEWLKRGDMGNEIIFNELQKLREQSNILNGKKLEAIGERKNYRYGNGYSC